MSSSFTVYNFDGDIPTYGCVTKLFYDLLEKFLSENGVAVKLKLRFELVSANGRHIPDETEEFIWSKNLQQTLWVSFENIKDEFYISVFENGKIETEMWEEIFDEEPFSKNKLDTIKKCLSNQWRWSIERTAGCGKISALIYGFMAASLAKLTNGIVYSCDSWPPGDFSCGCDYEEFMDIYLQQIKNHVSTLKDGLVNA